jgi:hypothetical protein
MIARVKAFLVPAVAGGLLAAVSTASPLTVACAPVAWLVFMLAGRGLPADERRWLMAVLCSAFAVRLAAIAGLFLMGLPGHSDISVGGLTGDDAYYLTRAIRGRDVLAGFAAGKYDYFVVSDAYGQTSYLRLLTWLQVAVGPTPYGMRVVNALLFVTGGALLFRTVRRGFGPVPAFVGLTALLFLPSLFVWSISLLKESLFFFVTAVLIAASIQLLRSPRAATVVPLIAAAALSLWLLDDLRRGGLLLAAAGLSVGIGARIVLSSARRFAVTAVLVAALGIGVLSIESTRTRIIAGVTSAAHLHAGHVFTIGHAYKLLDDGFYKHESMPDKLSGVQAGRFLVRAGQSFLLTPLPWQMTSRSELAFMPEHLVWYLALILAPIGAVAGWKRDPMLTCVLIGYLLPTAAVLAVTNGNVGTLLRLRGLVTPQLFWISGLGVVAVIGALAGRRFASPMPVLAAERSAP